MLQEVLSLLLLLLLQEGAGTKKMRRTWEGGGQISQQR